MSGIGREERGPIETRSGRNAETDRVREGISEGFHQDESERVAPQGLEANDSMISYPPIRTLSLIPPDKPLRSSPDPS